MKIKKVLFIVTSTNKIYSKDIKDKLGTAPLGVSYISAMLKLNGYQTMIVDMLITQLDKKQLDILIMKYKPDVIFISGAYTESIKNAYKIAKYIKSKYNKTLITGGSHVTFLPEEALENAFDYVILKEAEAISVKLLEYLKHPTNMELLESINGIAYKDKDNKCIVRQNGSNICDLDGIPFIYDDTFTVNIKRLKKVCSYMVNSGLNKVLRWKCES